MTTTNNAPEVAAPDTDEGTSFRREVESSLTLLPPVQPGQVNALESLDRHVKAVTKAEWLAERLTVTDIVPAKFKGRDKVGDATAAILFGGEVGLSPIASLRSVIVIHGMPGFEARTMKAILMSHGYRFRTVESTRTECTIEATSRDGRDFATATITYDDCILEGWVPRPKPDLGRDADPTVKTDWQGQMKSGRNGDYWVMDGNPKYITSPRTMLIAKSTAAVCRDIAPHLLLGMAAVEELESGEWLDGEFDDAPAATPAARAPRTTRAARNADRLSERAKAAAAEAANTQDAEVVDVPDETPAPAPAEPESTPAPVDEDDAKLLTPKQRSQGIDMMHALFSNAALPPDRAADRLIVAEAIVGHPVPVLDEVSNADLKAIGAKLKALKTSGGTALVDYVGDVLDTHAIDAARDAEAAAAGGAE